MSIYMNSLILLPFYRWGSWGMQRLSDLSKVTQLAHGGVIIWSQTIFPGILSIPCCLISLLNFPQPQRKSSMDVAKSIWHMGPIDGHSNPDSEEGNCRSLLQGHSYEESQTKGRMGPGQGQFLSRCWSQSVWLGHVPSISGLPFLHLYNEGLG